MSDISNQTRGKISLYFVCLTCIWPFSFQNYINEQSYMEGPAFPLLEICEVQHHSQINEVSVHMVGLLPVVSSFSCVVDLNG